MLLSLGVVTLVGALSIEIYRRTEATQLTNEQSMFHEEAEWILLGIESQTKNADTCTAMLGGTVFTPEKTESVALNYSYDNGFQGPLKPGIEVSQDLVLDELVLESASGAHSPTPADPSNGADMQTQSALYPGEKLTRYPVRLRMTITAKDRSLSTADTGPSGFTKPFYIWTNSSGTVLTCFGRESLGAFCNSMGGFYLESAGTPERGDLACRPSVHSSLWVNGHWTAKGACRYGGLVQDPNLCVSRFGSNFESVQLQATIPTGGMGAQYLCMSCQ
ncbi:MAG: hypothetical protein KF799_08710 [Bdellovibrionales bacterium]|nr:hypothetical protein [Bdellovibrionales bacterium]